MVHSNKKILCSVGEVDDERPSEAVGRGGGGEGREMSVGELINICPFACLLASQRVLLKPGNIFKRHKFMPLFKKATE